MKDVVDVRAERSTPERWREANRDYLDLSLRRIRLLLKRRVLWLRRLWNHDPLQGYQGMVISDAQADSLLAGGSDCAERRFHAENPEALSIGRELEGLENELRLARIHRPPLELLARILHLNEFDREVLILCLAPEIDPSFERLYAYAQDDVTQKSPTPHLAMMLFEGSGTGLAASWERFLPEAPLRRHRLLGHEAGWSSASAWTQADQPLRLDRRIASYLIGLNRMDEQVAALVKRLPPTDLLTSAQEEIVACAERLLKGGQGSKRVSGFNLVGPPRVGRKAVASVICQRLGLALHTVDLARLPANGREARDLARLLDREAALLPIAYLLDVSENEPTDQSELRAAKELVEEMHSLTFLASRDLWQGERVLSVLHIERSDAPARRLLWEKALGQVGRVTSRGTGEVPYSPSLNGGPTVEHASHWDDLLPSIVQQFDFGPAEIRKAVEMVGVQARLHNPDEDLIEAEDLWEICRVMASQSIRDLAQKLNACATWDDIVLPDDVVRQLREIAAQVAQRDRVYEEWGFGARLSRGRGIAALFSGASGTGKTMAAEVLANHLKLDLYRIDLSGVVSKYIGETEKNLRRVFDAAEQSGAILFFDEADALFGKRSEVKDSHDRYANIEINYLLQRMEEYRGLAILATNMKSLLDEAFLRRLRFLIDFPFPDAEHRLQIWRRVFPPAASVEDLDHRFLSRMEIPGGNIKNIALNAAFLAADAGETIRMSHIYHAARREYAKIEKLVMQSEFGPYYPEMQR